MNNYQVTVYTTNHCSSCQTLKQWLDKHQISYTVVNLEEEPDQQAQLIAKTGSFLVPQTIITSPDGGEEIIYGTQYAQIKAALGID